jgi:hypothetical protein
MNSKNAYALLCRKVYDIQLKLINKMIQSNLYNHYSFFVFIDDNTQDISEFKINYPNIQFIQIEDSICLEKGYKNMTYSITKTPVSWDKAVYYFCEVNNLFSYDFIWFVEDDVFIPNVEAISYLDNKYKDYDLLTKEFNLSMSYDRIDWHWHLGRNNALLPLFGSLVCTLRVSKKLLSIIRNYAHTFKKLFFLELMFPTLSAHNKLKNKIVPELSTILYRFQWEKNEKLIQKNFLYHPIKDLEVQKSFYEKINNIKL